MRVYNALRDSQTRTSGHFVCDDSGFIATKVFLLLLPSMNKSDCQKDIECIVIKNSVTRPTTCLTTCCPTLTVQFYRQLCCYVLNSVLRNAH